MENINVLAGYLGKPLSKAEELNTLRDLAQIEHRGVDTSLRIADRPISVSISFVSISALGFGCVSLSGK